MATHLFLEGCHLILLLIGTICSFYFMSLMELRVNALKTLKNSLIIFFYFIDLNHIVVLHPKVLDSQF